MCHTCDNPSCVNPNHLFLGTALDNNRDARKKGRSVNVRGEKHGMSKLFPAEVENIRNERKFFSARVLAEIYDVDRKTIDNICNRKNWI